MKEGTTNNYPHPQPKVQDRAMAIIPDTFADYLASQSDAVVELVGVKSVRPVFDEEGKHLHDVHTLTVRVTPTKTQQERWAEIAKPAPMLFDWETAARLIRERQPRVAMAGLQGEDNVLREIIFQEGRVAQHDGSPLYLCCSYRKPVISLDWGEDIECWRYQVEVPHWNASTFWPKTALQILAGENSTTSTTGC